MTRDRGPIQAAVWRPTLAIIGLMAGIPLIGATLSAIVESDPIPPLQLAGGVALTLPQGWQFVQRTEDQGIVISRGDVSLGVIVMGEGPVSLVLHDYVQAMKADATSLVVTDPAPFAAGSADDGLRVSYLGWFEGVEYAVEGDVTAVSSGETWLVFDGWASEGTYSASRSDVDDIIRGAVSR